MQLRTRLPWMRFQDPLGIIDGRSRDCLGTAQGVGLGGCHMRFLYNSGIDKMNNGTGLSPPRVPTPFCCINVSHANKRLLGVGWSGGSAVVLHTSPKRLLSVPRNLGDVVTLVKCTNIILPGIMGTKTNAQKLRRLHPGHHSWMIHLNHTLKHRA